MNLRFNALMLAAFITCGVDAHAQATFPFEQELLLDTRPMRPGKRMPALTVARDGRAVIDLWCRTEPGRVEISGDAIKVEAIELPPNPPEMQSQGQCTPERVAADEALRGALMATTNWRRKGQGVELFGSTPLTFRPTSN